MDSGYGNLSKISVPRLLHLIYSKNDETAVLEMVREPARKRFFFKNGLPVAASSNILNEVLGRLLVQKGVISQDDYQRSLEVVLREKKRHGEVLISMGMISSEKLDDFLSLQLKERILKVFGWTEGEYRYAVAPRLPADMSEYPHHPAALIIDGIELGFYPDSRAREELRGYLDKKTKLRSTLGRYRLEDLRLNLQEKRFLDLFDGTRTLREILDAAALLRRRAVSLALSFINMGLVSVEGLSEGFEMLGTGTEALQAVEQAGGDSRLNAEFLFVKAKSALLNRDYRGALEILEKITDINPLEGEYWAYLGWAVYNGDHGRIKEAQALIKDSIDLDNDIDMAWYFLGVLFLEQGDLSWAERAFKTAHAKNPWISEALVELKRLEMAKALAPPDDADRKGLYAEYFSFSKDPFSTAPSPCPAPLAREESRCVDGLVQGVEKNAGGMLLTGEEGAGKTTVALELIRRLSNSRVLCAMVLEPEDKELRLMRTINSELYASVESQAIRELLISLGSRVSQNAILGGRTLIIIDRAETLTEGCLKLVQYLTRLKTLQIILAARPAFIERLKAPEFKELDQRLSTRLSLGPFTPEDTKAFILRRIESASKSGTRPIIIKDSALELLHSGSRGLASLVNANAARVLALAAELRTNILDKELVELALKRPEGREPAPVPPALSADRVIKKEPPPPPTVKAKGVDVSGAEAERFVPAMGPDVAEAGFDEVEEAHIEPATVFEAPESPLLEAEVEQGQPEARTGAEGEASAVAPPAMEMTAGLAQPVPATQTPTATPAPQAPVKGVEAGKGLKRLTLIILLIVLAGLAIGAATGYYYLIQSNGGPDSTRGAAPIAAPPTPSPLPQEAPTPPASPTGAEGDPPPADTPGQSAPGGAINNPGAGTGPEGNDEPPRSLLRGIRRDLR
ncbi:MAG: AAA family ATPase [Deltaproteobacteria bacterium]|nr:AAA family ATPase [Deltaproteobacteria bacterium]